MRVTTTVLAAVVTVAVAGGSAVAHATAADADQTRAARAHVTAPRPGATVAAQPASATAAAQPASATAAVDTARPATAQRAEAATQTLRREGPYPNAEIAAAAAQLTIALGRASGYYLVQVWDTVRQTTNWWINYT
ncbi:hypothetical protein ACGF5F_15970 [Streptomyces sp. NPDC047821]|uniref:hypothetical protein n=1 Tax=Streptomyces sp. NPDC047821 TaxID=3365488 RepID=UPI00371BDDEE